MLRFSVNYSRSSVKVGALLRVTTPSTGRYPNFLLPPTRLLHILRKFHTLK